MESQTPGFNAVFRDSCFLAACPVVTNLMVVPTGEDIGLEGDQDLMIRQELMISAQLPCSKSAAIGKV